MFTQLLVNGLIAGSIYALVASGFSMIYFTNKFVNFAHGATVVFSGYFLFWFFNLLGLNFWLSSILALLFTVFLGLGMHFLYKLFRKRKSSNVILLVASFGILIFLESFLLILFGADVKTINFIPVQKGVSVLGAIITPLQIIILVVSILLFIALYLFMKYSKIGKAMRAVSDSKEVSEIVGIDSERIYAWGFIISSFIAGIAGILIALEQNLEPSMGTSLVLKGFTGAIIGGIGSIPGSVLGSFLLGLVENFGIWYLPSGYKDAIAFTLLFIFLLFIPNGIFGKRK
ncbi:MAG: branched-chain amino acid ABC transporter permease [Candidatus Woesearchaeota archaeon]